MASTMHNTPQTAESSCSPLFYTQGDIALPAVRLCCTLPLRPARSGIPAHRGASIAHRRRDGAVQSTQSTGHIPARREMK